jgi:hypothetical protein
VDVEGSRVLSWHLPRETKENHKTADRITNVMVGYLSQKSSDANQKCYHLSQLAQSQIISDETQSDKHGKVYSKVDCSRHVFQTCYLQYCLPHYCDVHLLQL